MPGTFVAKFWDWWMNVQLKDRLDWGLMLKLHGKNGLLQLMAMLL
jgi:hypothetical protein